MSEEEKKAIEKFNNLFQKSLNGEKITDEDRLDYIDFTLISSLFDKNEKLKKENEELKNKVAKRNNELIELEETSEKEFLTKQEVNENYIPKDKIREKIEELEEYIVKEEEETCGKCITIGEDMTIRYLKELLEEE